MTKPTPYEIQIAKDVLKLYKDHENSWNGNTYILGSIRQNLHSYFQNLEPKTMLSIALDTFAVQWTSDLASLCQEILSYETTNPS